MTDYGYGQRPLWRDPVIVGVPLAVLFFMLAAMVAGVRAEDRKRAECANAGGVWGVVGHQTTYPIYVKSGSVYVPVGGGTHDVYGCIGGRDHE